MMTTEFNKKAFGKRLQASREKKRYTRIALAKETGIPDKSQEKFEYGDATPTIERLYTLAKILNVSTRYLLEGDEAQVLDEIEPTNIIDEDEIPEHDQIFRELDGFRSEGFEKYWRTVPQLIEKLDEFLNGVEFNDLLDIAENRALFFIGVNQVAEMEKAKDESQAEQVTEIKERIIDTAYFGNDFYTLDENSLSNLAKDLDLEGDIDEVWDRFWSDKKTLIFALRPVCRELALKGKCPGLLKQGQHKNREVA